MTQESIINKEQRSIQQNYFKQCPWFSRKYNQESIIKKVHNQETIFQTKVLT